MAAHHGPIHWQVGLIDARKCAAKSCGYDKPVRSEPEEAAQCEPQQHARSAALLDSRGDW